MKRILIILAMLVAVNANAQWTWQNPLPHGNTYIDIKFVNQNKGFVAGEYGQFYMTTNHGVNWQSVNLGISKHINAVYFINDNTGWICGDSSVLYKTVNGGTNWFQKVIGMNGNYSDIYFLNDSIGFLSVSSYPSYILRTENAGENWLTVYSGSYNHINRFFFSNENTGWTTATFFWVGGHYNSPYTNLGLLSTSNKGISWIYNNVSTSIIGGWINSNSITYVNSNTGFISGESPLNLKTINAGSNWSNLPMDAFTINFKNSNIGFAADSKIFKTINIGTNWIAADSTYPVRFKSIYIKDSLEAWFTGTGGAIVSTVNSGASFQEHTFGDKHNVNSICFTDGINGYTCGNNGVIMKTTNAGTNWILVNSNIPNNKTLHSISFMNPNTGWVGSDSSIYKTTNGGNTWVRKNFSNYSYGYINKVFFLNSGIGFAVSTAGRIFKSTDFGESWNQNLPVLYSPHYDLFFLQPNILMLLTGKVMFKSSNYGMQWDTAFYWSTGYMNYASFINQNTGWIASNYSTISGSVYYYINKTTNGGMNWTTNTSAGVNNIYFNNNLEGVYSTNDILMKTSNGGLNWFNFALNGNYIQGLCAKGKDLYVIGSYGMIIKGTDIFTTDIRNESNIIPDKYSLFQNYPNPFNPITNVKFSIVNSGDVKLVVYDIQGREIQTLVNERLQPGTYEAVFEGSALNSSVYFYKLVTGNFTETKKMILIK